MPGHNSSLGVPRILQRSVSQLAHATTLERYLTGIF